MGQSSAVCIATRYWQDGPESNPVGARFFEPIPTDPEAIPASCAMGIGSSSRGYSGRGVA
jgi:hypothetical protein